MNVRMTDEGQLICNCGQILFTVKATFINAVPVVVFTCPDCGKFTKFAADGCKHKEGIASC